MLGMLGGMLVFFFMQSGVPMPLALVLVIAIPAVVGMLLEILAVESARDAVVATLIIITIGASLAIRGLVPTLAARFGRNERKNQ